MKRALPLRAWVKFCNVKNWNEANQHQSNIANPIIAFPGASNKGNQCHEENEKGEVLDLVILSPTVHSHPGN
jgi:hypothetical protein